MWSKVFLATLLLGLTLAEKKNVTEKSIDGGAKEKRQTEHETRSIPLSLIANRRQQGLHQQPQEYYQSEEAPGPFYAPQTNGGQPYKPSAVAHKPGASQEQPQYQELPPEYISLLHQLAEHQPKAAALKQGKAISQQYEPQSHAQHPKPSQVQYITEEEYAQLLKQAQQQPGPVAPPQSPSHHHPHHQHQPQPQPQGLQAYGRPSTHGAGGPAGSHKYRPAIQLLETGEEQSGAYGQPDGEQYRIQYKSIQQAGTVTPVPKPVSSFSFENELAKLVESNRPLAYHQVPHHPGRHEGQHDAQRYGPTPSPQSHEYTYVQAGGPAHDHGAPHPPKQSIKAQYIAPFAQGLPLTGPKISPAHLQVGPQKFVDSPAPKYQFIAQPESGPSKAHHQHHAQHQHLQQQQQQQQQHHHQAPAHQGQQYFAEVSPKQHPGTPSPKIQYYVPKEKNVQIYYQQAQQQQQQQQQQHSVIEQHSPQHPMKIVEAPQLQNEKPQKTAQSHHRSKPAEQQQVHQHRYATREKQPEPTDAHVPSRSAIYVSQSTGVNQATAAATPAPAAHYGGEKHGHKIPPKIDRPLTQEEFQALVDAGYSVVPVPVPVPVPISQYQQQAGAHAGVPHPGPRGGPHPTPAGVSRQAAQASRYHLHQLATAENNPNQVVTYLRPLHLDPFSAGVRGPHKAAP
ncbi:neurogenic protein mastermind [Anopheles nili]|uniref:neurogenic protein mastermind n=1 Tax=Anopheles nili TaxID=185578 RepID=UPI00237B87ED|nr:neurogenic protein mastermind [Anopheles nili]